MKQTISALLILFVLFFFICNYLYADEKITLSTYYPAPYGEYRTLAIGDTYVAPAAGGNADLVVEGNVGIGTTDPKAILHVGDPIYFSFNDQTNIASRRDLDTGVNIGAVAHFELGPSAGGSSTNPSLACLRSIVWTDRQNAVAVCGTLASNAGNESKAIYGRAADASATPLPNAWAGYFDGRGYFSGNVGIGTTNPSQRLDIANAGNVGTIIQTTNTTNNSAFLTIRGANATGSGVDISQLRFENNGSSGFEGARIALRNDRSSTTPDSDLLFYTNDGSGITEKARITEIGSLRLGIGSITDTNDDGIPDERSGLLHVYGDEVTWYDTSTTPASGRRTAAYFEVLKPTGGTAMGWHEGVKIVAGGGNDRTIGIDVEATHPDTTGIVYGVKTSASGPGDASGTMTRYGVNSIASGSGGNKTYAIYGSASGDSSNDKYGVYGIAGGANGTKYGVYGTATGGGTNYAAYFEGPTWSTTGWGGPSDARLKKNIIPLKGSLNKIIQLQGVNFEWRADEYPDMGLTVGKQIGLIGQDTEKIFPEITLTNDKGYIGIQYDKLTAVLIEAVKELKTENDSLKERIVKLEEKMQEQ